MVKVTAVISWCRRSSVTNPPGIASIDSLPLRSWVPLLCCGQTASRSMVESRRDIGEEILEGIRQLKCGEHGRIVNVHAITSIREKTELCQSKSAGLLGVSVRTLQEWEQGRRKRSGAARTLLLIAEKNPRALVDFA